MGITTRQTRLAPPMAGSYGRQGRINTSRRNKRKRLLLEQQEPSPSSQAHPRTRAKSEATQRILRQTPSPQRHVVSTPPSASGMQTRKTKGKPTCLSYGKIRHIFYGKEYFLCHACDM